jgi:ABC-type multidrug transport system ATPase subunit/signal transduction histidine kinase
MVATARAPASSIAQGEPLLRVKQLFVSYGSLRVLEGVDFELWDGELVALVGENGAGKSTVVRCVAGDLAPSGGEVTFAGARARPGAEGLAVVWQDASLCDNLDVPANLFLGREQGRWYLSEVKAFQAAKRVLESYGVRFGTAKSVRTLSKGQRQLIALARAMQDNPRLLVLDEPTASLGAQEARQVEELISELKARGTTVLLVSHDLEQVFSLADRILVLHGGRVAADLVPTGTHPDEVVAIMSGHDPGTTARHQMGRLQALVDQLAKSKAATVLPLILSALAAALSTGQLCIHLVEGSSLRLVASTGLPRELVESWSLLPVGEGGGPMGLVASSGQAVMVEDIVTGAVWARFARLARLAGARSSWSVPLVGSRGLIGVITGCQPFAGPLQRDQLNLVSLYAGYVAGAIERDQLFEEVSARNQVLETVREVLETLAGPEPVPEALLTALASLQRGLSASEVELWVKDAAGGLECRAFLDADGQPHGGPVRRDPSAADDALRARMGIVQALGDVSLGISFAVPSGGAALLARWFRGEPPEYAEALMEDAAHSLRLAFERQEAEEAHQQTAALRRSHQLQRGFLSRLSHELRTPLTAIRGYATSLLAPDVTWDEESKTRFLLRIADESARLGRLVGDLLDVSAMESGLLRLQPDWCDPALVVEAAVSCLPPERAPSVSVRASEVAPVWADHDRLEQVFVNLLDNAFHHNPPGVKVSVEVFMEGPSTLAVRVADDGKGLPPELASQFRSTWPKPPAATQLGALEGAGLGLGIALGIVEAHGGTMRLEPTSRGTSFLVLLPTEGPAERAERAV